MATRNVEYIIQLRDKFSKGIDRLNSRAFQLDNRMKRLDKSSKGLGSTLTKVFAGVAILAGIKKSISAFEDQEFAIAQVRQGLVSTGNAVGKTLQELTKSAKELQENSIFGDETILQGVTAQILTFANITEGAFDRTQQAVLDVTTRLFGARATMQNLRGTSIQLGKALNDPIGQLGALSRSGITFSKSQVEVIKKLAETGRLAEAQGVILTELERQYGGSAKAAQETALGGLAVLQARFQDLLVIIGQQFIPVVLDLKDGLKGLIGFLTENQKAIQILVKLTIAATAAFVAYKTVTFLLTAGIRAYVVAVKLSVIATRFFTKGTKAATAATRIFGLAVKTTPIGLIASLLATAAAAFLFFRDKTVVTSKTFSGFRNIINIVSSAFSGFFAVISKLVSFVLSKLQPAFTFISNIFKVIGNSFIKVGGIIKKSLISPFTELKGIISTVFDFIVDKIIGFFDFLSKIPGVSKAIKVFKNTFKKERLEFLNEEKKLIDRIAKPIKDARRITPTIGGIAAQQIGTTKITSAAPKIFNINIDKLVENVNISTTTLKQGVNGVTKEITEAFLGVLTDVQLQVR